MNACGAIVSQAAGTGIRMLPGRLFWLLSTLLFVAGCGSRSLLPDISEESQLLAAADLRDDKRYAVVTRTGNFDRNVPDKNLAQPIVEGVAATASELLGVDAVPLDQSRDGPWATELRRSWEEAGFFETIDQDEFFIRRGFDGYIVAMAESRDFSGEASLGSQPPPKPGDNPFDRILGPPLTLTFEPQYRIYQFVDGESQAIMRSGKAKSFDCTLRDVASGGGVLRLVAADPEGCSQKFVDVFRDYLAQRVELMPVSSGNQ